MQHKSKKVEKVIDQYNLDEVKKVINQHKYSINNIICEVMKKFKFKSICSMVGLVKQDGYPASEIVKILILFPLMLLNTVHALYRSQYNELTKMKKDTIYRLKNNERMPWRSLLKALVKRYQELVNPNKEINPMSAFIIDDTINLKTGEHIEKVSIVHNHLPNGEKKNLGFKNLTLGYFDGKSILPLDFSLHSEKALSKKKRDAQFSKKCLKNSNGYKRREETKIDKITNSISMIKRAVKNGFLPKYTLCDSWFASLNFIRSIREIKSGSIHVVAGIRRDSRKYIYQDREVNAKELLKILESQGNCKRYKSRKLRYYEVLVKYKDIGEVKLYFSRIPYQKHWRAFISTDTTLSYSKMLEVYSIRWTIEILFKELKQHLCLGRCQSRDFDAHIASITVSMILYLFLSYFRRVNDYETIGRLFEIIKDDMIEKTIAQRIWNMFEELICVVVNLISKTEKVDIRTFKQSIEYKYVKELFEESFLSAQILDAS